MPDRIKIRDRLQQQYSLKVLRIYLDNSMSDKSIAIFRLTLGNGEEVALLTASMQEIGLPSTLATCAESDAVLRDAVFRLPDHIVGSLKSVLCADEADSAPLWLRLSVPVGLLPAVPWEALLQPHLDIPILRLPHQRICPRMPTSDIDIVICISAQVDEPDLHGRMEQFIEQVPPDLAAATDFHLFAGTAMYPAMLGLKRKFESHISIAVYPPPDSVGSSFVEASNSWLSWIRTSLGNRSADVVHFLCHGYQISGEGALAFSPSPAHSDSTDNVSLIYAPELVEFLNEVGAWCVVFTRLPSDGGASGIRMLQNSVARLRPGPSVMHDMGAPDSRRALGAVYRFLFTPPQPAPVSSAISLYCHPIWLSDKQVDDDSNHQLREFTLDGRMPDSLVGTDVPTWLASSQRKLEISAEEIAEAEELDPDTGRKRARALVLNAIAEHAQQTPLHKSNGGDDRSAS